MIHRAWIRVLLTVIFALMILVMVRLHNAAGFDDAETDRTTAISAKVRLVLISADYL